MSACKASYRIKRSGPKEKYTRKDFIFRAKKVPEKTDIILMPKIVVVLKMSDDDLSKYDKFSFVIS